MAVALVSSDSKGQRVTTVWRVALVALVALLMAGAGAVGGFAVHWYVLQPSDDELREHVTEVTPDGAVILGEPTITGAWAPSFERGSLHWEAFADGRLSVAAVAQRLEEAGWTPGPPRQTHSVQELAATKGPLRLDVSLSPVLDAERTDVGLTITRRPHPISLGMAVALGAGLGALVGAVLGWFGPRLRPRRTTRPA